MQQTAMQELIEYVEKYIEVFGMTAVMLRDKAKSLLEKEKKQVIDAYLVGKEHGESLTEYTGNGDYFNNKFNS